MGLVHVEGFLNVAAQRSDEDLVNLVLHYDVRKPPALRSLNAVSAVNEMSERCEANQGIDGPGTSGLCKSRLGNTGRRDGRSYLRLLG